MYFLEYHLYYLILPIKWAVYVHTCNNTWPAVPSTTSLWTDMPLWQEQQALMPK